jgi:hypothetical protein
MAISISIGDDCAVANIINCCYLPFDWCLTKHLSVVIDILDSDLEIMRDWSKYHIDITKIYDKFPHISNDGDDYIDISKNIDNSHMLYFSISGEVNPTSIKYPHDIRTDNHLADFEEFKQKMERRILRFKSIPIENRIFYRYENYYVRNITKQNLDRILKHCSILKIWLNPVEYQKMLKSANYNYVKSLIDSGRININVDEKWQNHEGWQKKLDLF